VLQLLDNKEHENRIEKRRSKGSTVILHRERKAKNRQKIKGQSRVEGFQEKNRQKCRN
jgi:hypothetical protein